MSKPKALMTDLKVDFVSLVDKGANKKQFAIFKSADADNKDTPATEPGKEPVEKNAYSFCGPFGSSFKGALQAISQEEKVEESRDLMNEYFYILKNVMGGVLFDEAVTDKAGGIKKAIDEFRDATVSLFNEIPVKKSNDDTGKEGGTMGQKQDATAVDKAAGKADGGFSANGQPDAQNRKGDSTTVDGVSKKVRKAELEKLIAHENIELAMSAKDAAKDKLAREKMKKSVELIEVWETELEEIQKAVGDRSEGAPATGENTVSSNDPVETQTQTVVTEKATGVEKKDAAPAASAPVKKDAIGTDATPEAQTPQGGQSVDETNGNISGQLATFMKTLEVTLDGKLGAMSDLLKADVTKLVDEKLANVEKTVSSVSKMSGFSNSDDMDFDDKAEAARDSVQKDENAVWGEAMSGSGEFKKKAK